MLFSEIRKTKGKTQQDIADGLKVKQSTVAMWESGKSVPAMKNLISLSALLEVDMGELVASFKKNEEKTKEEFNCGED